MLTIEVNDSLVLDTLGDMMRLVQDTRSALAAIGQEMGSRIDNRFETQNHQVDNDSVRICFGTDYAVYHEFGTPMMPRRDLIFDNPEQGSLALDDQAAILDILSAYLAAN